MRDRFAKPEVTVASDEPLRGTPFRACYMAIGVDSLTDSRLERVRAAIAGVISNPEITVTYQGEKSLLDRGNVVTLRVTYYGAQVPGEKVVEAVRSAL